MKYLVFQFLLIGKIIRRIKMFFLRPLFFEYGRNFIFDPHSFFTFQRISVGNDVYIGPGAYFSSTRAFIYIGNKVLFGPNVTIICGDHRIDKVGAYIYDQKDTDKTGNEDMPVRIEDDVWVGSGVTILKGVTIGTGSVIAAGAVVTKDILPYSIVGGVPAKLIKMRFLPNELEVHKLLLSKNEGK
jgi:acetyltransferase-like isoleucine patch superfamily enzyme